MVDGTTANSLAAGYRGPPQDGHAAKAKLLARSCLRILDQGLAWIPKDAKLTNNLAW